MFRQQLAGTADYAASIGKLQIALRGVVGSQEAYDAAIRSAAAATRDLNIPQEEATRGLTRLSAAVIGAGGTVADSSFAFRAMSEAIKATGGNAEQVDGALLALTQVFSKGKVSAEELNQIAERLPGTFTLFAQAAGKTGPELQKALEQGEVGLNDLMKFLALTGDRFRTTAAAISSSSQDAGARLTVAFQAMRLEVGKALQPLGAELQETFTAFIKDITPAVVGSAKALAGALSFLIDNQVAAGLAKFVLGLGVAVGTVYALQVAFAALAAIKIPALLTAAGAAATGATGAFAALNATLLVNPWIALAAGITAAVVALSNYRTEAQKTASTITGRGSVTAADRQKLDSTLQDISLLNLKRKTARGPEVASIDRRLTRLQAEANLLREAIKPLDAAEAASAAAAKTLSTFVSPAVEGKGSDAADKAKRDAEAAAAEQQRYLESFMQQQIRVADTVFQHQKDLDRQRFDLLKELTDIEAQNRINKLFGPEREAANIQERRRQRTLEYENRILAAMNAVAAAQQKFGSAQQMAAVTAGASLPGGTVANILPGTRGGPNINEGVGYGRGRLHAGQDLGLDIGDPIHARRAGTVMQAYPSGFGKVGGAVVVRYDDGTQGTYGHTTPSVRAGTAVAAGQRIATVAPDGSNTHLHYELRDALGKLVNPINALTASLKVPAGRQATGVAAQQRRNVTDTGDVALAGLDITQAEATLANLTAQRDRFNAAFNQEQINALTSSLTTQNYELEKTVALETKRFDLVLKGYSAERIALEQKFDQARIARDAALTGVGDETQVLAINTAYERQVELLQQLYDAQTQFNNSFGAGFQTGVQQYVQSLGTMNQAAAQLTQSGLKGIEDTLFSLVTTGTANFREFAAEILKQSARMVLQLTIQRVIMQIVGAISGASTNLGDSAANVAKYSVPLPNAMGNAFAKNNIVPYAMGGVVSKPTLFKFAQGGAMRTGLMGEAGPEAIMPLSRGANGKLGVASTGGGSTSVVVNVDASGNSQVAGDQNQGAQLGRVIAGAVQQELINQRRPGGLLSGMR
jgi:lambda family phage tail tape measure protein